MIIQNEIANRCRLTTLYMSPCAGRIESLAGFYTTLIMGNENISRTHGACSAREVISSALRENSVNSLVDDRFSHATQFAVILVTSALTSSLLSQSINQTSSGSVAIPKPHISA